MTETLDVERLAAALHDANVDCDYERRFDLKRCGPAAAFHLILAGNIAREYVRGRCTYHGCGLPANDPVHPQPNERMGRGRHVFRIETAA